MSSWRPKKCRVCGVKAEDGYTISKQGMCPRCGLDAARRAITAMHERHGREYEAFVANGGKLAPKARRIGVGGTRQRPRETSIKPGVSDDT